MVYDQQGQQYLRLLVADPELFARKDCGNPSITIYRPTAADLFSRTNPGEEGGIAPQEGGGTDRDEKEVRVLQECRRQIVPVVNTKKDSAARNFLRTPAGKASLGGDTPLDKSGGNQPRQLFEEVNEEGWTVATARGGGSALPKKIPSSFKGRGPTHTGGGGKAAPTAISNSVSTKPKVQGATAKTPASGAALHPPVLPP